MSFLKESVSGQIGALAKRNAGDFAETDGTEKLRRRCRSKNPSRLCRLARPTKRTRFAALGLGGGLLAVRILEIQFTKNACFLEEIAT